MPIGSSSPWPRSTPDRDTADVITGYVRSFLSDAHALRTDDDQELRGAASAFGVAYTVTPSDDGEVEVTHTGALYAVDNGGELLVTWPFGTTIDDQATDIEILLGSA